MKRHVLGAVLAGILLTGYGPRARASLLTGLAGYWQFNGNGADSSGNGRDLTLVGNPSFAPGLYGQALDLHDNGAQYA